MEVWVSVKNPWATCRCPFYLGTVFDGSGHSVLGLYRAYYVDSILLTVLCGTEIVI